MAGVVVTGGARGIGASTARMLAASGWSVCIGFREREDAAAALVDAVRSAGGAAIAVRGDVADEGDVIRLFDEATAAFGPPRALVNNAGMLASASPLAEMTLERWQRTIAINLNGAFLCAREAVRRMAISRGHGGGAIVNVSSMAAVLGGAHEFVDYAASKGALDSLTIGLAKEVAADGIRVNGVRPGLIDTEIHASSDASRVATLLPSVPMQRMGTADEVAQAIVWLVSDASAYCSGTTINVSGGR